MGSCLNRPGQRPPCFPLTPQTPPPLVFPVEESRLLVLTPLFAPLLLLHLGHGAKKGKKQLKKADEKSKSNRRRLRPRLEPPRRLLRVRHQPGPGGRPPRPRCHAGTETRAARAPTTPRWGPGAPRPSAAAASARPRPPRGAAGAAGRCSSRPTCRTSSEAEAEAVVVLAGLGDLPASVVSPLAPPPPLRRSWPLRPRRYR